MARYLIDLELPAKGTVCPEDGPPFGGPVEEGAGAATPVAATDVTAQTSLI
jgi:hypothetical protein